jgi:hypothetical protein
MVVPHFSNGDSQGGGWNADRRKGTAAEIARSEFAHADLQGELFDRIPDWNRPGATSNTNQSIVTGASWRDSDCIRRYPARLHGS